MALPKREKMSGVAPTHVRHKPEQTLLYQLVEQYWPEFQNKLSETGRFLPRHVTREFEDYLACGRLEKGFLRVRCESCSREHLAWAAPYLQLQASRLLHQLWRQTHGGDRCTSGGSRTAAQSCPPVGTKLPVSA